MEPQVQLLLLVAQIRVVLLLAGALALHMLRGDAADLLWQARVEVLLNDAVVAVVCVHLVDHVLVGGLLEVEILAALRVDGLHTVSLAVVRYRGAVSTASSTVLPLS